MTKNTSDVDISIAEKSSTYSSMGEPEADQLTDSEKQLEDTFNNWANLTKKQKFDCFLLFSKDFSKKFFPVSLVFCIYVITNFANILFVSNSKDPDSKNLLAGVGIGVIIYNMVGISICFGLASALDTLCTHAYGAKLYYLMGCYLNRSLVILTLVFIPVFFILFFIEPLLLLINQKVEIAYYAGKFCRGLCPGLWFFYQTDAKRRYIIILFLDFYKHKEYIYPLYLLSY